MKPRMGLIALALGALSSSAGAFAQAVATSFQFPVVNYSSRIGQRFGEINSDYGNKKHVADDVLAPKGTEVVAAGNGRVMFARKWKDCPNWGHVVVIEHELATGDRVNTIYGHLDPDSILVAENSTVTKGKPIGSIGQWVSPVDGTSCWPDHLHFGARAGSYGAAIGTYPAWLAGYLSQSSFPGTYCDPSDLVNNLRCGTVGGGSALAITPNQRVAIAGPRLSECSNGERVTYRITGGLPPYRVSVNYGGLVSLERVPVVQDGGGFDVLTLGYCFTGLRLSIVDSMGNTLLTGPILDNIPGQ